MLAPSMWVNCEPSPEKEPENEGADTVEVKSALVSEKVNRTVLFRMSRKSVAVEEPNSEKTVPE